MKLTRYAVMESILVAFAGMEVTPAVVTFVAL
jgi:hypothetical protein